MACQPTHRIHSDNEPLSTGIVDYSEDNINRLADQDMYPATQRNTTTTTHPNTHSPSHIPDPASIGREAAERAQLGSEYSPETRPGESRSEEPSGFSDKEYASNARLPDPTRRSECRFDGLTGDESASNAKPPIPGQASIGRDDANRDQGAPQGAKYPTDTHRGESRSELERDEAASSAIPQIPSSIGRKDANLHPGAMGGAEDPTDTRRSEGMFDGQPEAKPSLADKFIGNAEKLAGKVTHDPNMEAKGAIRSQVGKN